MNCRRLVFTAVLTAFCIWPVYLISRELGAPARSTGGVFSNFTEQSCAAADCHDDGMPNMGPGSLSMTISGAPFNQYHYDPGETVPVVVRIADPEKVRWGFQITARTPDGCSQAGMFSLSPNDPPPAVFIREDTEAPPPCPVEAIQFPTHSFPRFSQDGQMTFEVNWTAPSADIGPIVFAAAGNAANGNRESSGDNIYTVQATVEPAEGGGGPAPSINPGGAVLSTGTPVITQASPNAIVTVFGQDFAPEGTLVINPELDENGRVSTQLANTCVEINGQRSPMFAVLPTQINLQVHHEVGLGNASVEVIRGCGTGNEQRSAPENPVVSDVSPGFFNFVNNTDGRNPIAALHQNGVDLVGPPGLFGAAVETTPAQPGEFVSLFGTGFGSTDPPFEAGEIPQNSRPENPLAPVTGSVSVTIGGIPLAPADIFYAGVAPCCAGLYQLVVKVPENAPDGDLPVVVTVSGVSSPEGPFITVMRP